MSLSKISVLSTLILSLASAQKSPSPMLDICGVHLVVGMSKDKAFDQMARECTFTKFGTTTDAWVLADTSPQKVPQGIVEFQSAKLSSAKRSWAPASGSSDEFARALIVAMDNVVETNDKVSTAVVQPRITHSREFDVYSLDISLPTGRRVAVMVMYHISTHKTMLLDIEESIGQ